MIKDTPYKFICDWAETIFPHTGKKVFRILALMIPSLIIPDLPYKGQKIRSNINSLFLAPPGAGKTSISKIFSYLTYNPLEVESITPARLESELNKVEYGSLIVGDFARMSRDQIIVKIVEGILGEEKRISRKTMRGDSEGQKELIGLLCGVPGDLSGYLTSGLIFRVVPLVVFHDSTEHSNIGEYINENMGIEEETSKEKQDEIKEYYEELLEIQTGRHKMSPILSYKISDEIKKKIFERWDMLTKKAVEDTRLIFFRELHEGYRFLIAHAFLNVFNRKIENQRLIPNNQDLKVALYFMTENIILKKKLLKFEGFARNLKSIKELDEVLKNSKLNQTDRGVLKSLVKKS